MEGDTKCEPCGNVARTRKHIESESHIANELFAKLENCGHTDEYPVITTAVKNVKICKNSVTVGLQEKGHKNVILNFEDSDNLVLDSVGTPCECGYIDLVTKTKPKKTKSGAVDIGDLKDEKPKMLGDTTLTVDCFARTRGKKIVPVIINCTDMTTDTRRKLIINIIIVTENDEYKGENDKPKFCAKSRKREWRGNRVTNKLPDDNDASELEYERTLKNISLDQDFSAKDLSEEHLEILKARLNKENYVQKLRLLLNIEYGANIQYLRENDMEDVVVQLIEDKTFKLETTSLPESIKKIVKGDKIKLTNTIDNHETAYEAVITEIDEGFVLAESKNETLTELIKGNPNFDVHFLLSDYTFKMQNRALDLISSTNLVERLLAQEKLPVKDDKVMSQLDFIDEQVKANREQAMAVEAIVNRTSGKDPV